MYPYVVQGICIVRFFNGSYGLLPYLFELFFNHHKDRYRNGQNIIGL